MGFAIGSGTVVSAVGTIEAGRGVTYASATGQSSGVGRYGTQSPYSEAETGGSEGGEEAGESDSGGVESAGEAGSGGYGAVVGGGERVVIVP